MRLKVLFILALIIARAGAQNYQVSFEGTGAGNIIDSVNVENLSQCKSILLAGGDILNLNGNNGIEDFTGNAPASLHVSPNPITDFCIIEFKTNAAAETAIELYDLAGRKIAGINEFLSKGEHKFRLKGIGSGIFLLKAVSDNFSFSTRIISCSMPGGMAELNHIESASLSNSSKHSNAENEKADKGAKSLVNMEYTPGDILKLTGKSGIYRTVFMLVPTQSQSVTFNFVACTDVDKNNYPVVQIGTQLWMAQNINVGIRINGSEDQTYNNRPIEKYCYNNLESNCKIYGGLYQWGEMMQYDSTGKTKGICPIGWHIPSDAEFNVLTDYLGGLEVSSGRMKAVCTSLWENPNAGATNETGITLLPGGMRYMSGDFRDKGRYWDFWTSTEYASWGAWYRDIGYSDTKVHRAYYYKSNGFSVRCLKD